MLIRLACLLFAAAIARAGIVEESPALIAVATAILGLSLVGIASTRSNETCRMTSSAAQKRPRFTQRVIWLACIAAGLSFFAAANSTSLEGLLALAMLAWLLTFVALGLLGLALDGLSLKQAGRGVRWVFERRNRPELASVLAITIVALVLRVYHLDTIPLTIHGDEGDVGNIALQILAGGHVQFFQPAPFYNPVSYYEAFFITLFGPTVAGMRMASAIAGTLCIPIVYSIGRIGWGPLAGAMAAWLMAVSHLAIHYSRLSQVFMDATMATALAMLLLTLAAQQAHRRAVSLERGLDASSYAGGAGVWTWMLLAGAATGFSLQIYLATRIVPMIAGLLLLYMLWLRWIGPWHIAAYGFAVALTFLPMAMFYADHPLAIVSRTDTVSIFQDWYVHEILGPDATLPSALPALLAEQTRRTLGIFITTGDWGGFYSSSLSSFDPLTAAMMWLGFGIVASRIRRYHELSLVLWIVICLVLGSVLTLGAKNGQRILIMTPAAFLLGGVLVARTFDLVRLTPLKQATWLVAPVGTSLALWLLSANVATYFYDFVPRYEAGEASEMGRVAARDRGRYHVYILSQGRFDSHLGSISYVAHGIPIQDLKNAADFRPPPDDGQGVLVMALENYLPDLRAIESRVPGGEEQRVTAPTGRLLFIAYRVPPPT